MELTVLEQFPPGLLECEASQLYNVLRGPTLIHIEGKNKPAIFVSVLLHGNETTGWDAVRKLMKQYQQQLLPRSMSLFIGNVEAARENQRLLSGGLDFNRIWPSEKMQSDIKEHKLAKHVTDIMQQRGVFISIDIHNNTGLNPHYACVNKLDNQFAYVANLFSKIIIHFTFPEGVQSQAFSKFCPAITIECGQVGFKHGISHALEYLDTCLRLQHIPTELESDNEIIFYENFAAVTIASGIHIGFEGSDQVPDYPVDLLFYPDLDQYNFTELALGTPLAHVNSDKEPVINVTSNDGVDLTQDYFQIKDSVLVNRVQLMPSMLTSDAKIVRKDCLCYLMRRILP